MKFSLLIRSLLAFSLFKLGVTRRKIRRHSKEGFLILMYHRILPLHKVDHKIQPGMYVLDKTFKTHLVFLKRFFAIISLNQLARGTTGFPESSGKPICCLTFDDGWADFYDYAYPLLKSLNVPATVFLPTDYISSTKRFWTDALADLIERDIELKADSVTSKNPLRETISEINRLKTGFEKKLEYAIENLKKYPQHIIDKILEDSASAHEPSIGDNMPLFLNWKQVREMRSSNLVSFGSHTCGHRILTTLKEEEIHSELEESKEKLLEEDVCDEGFIPFCYPNGNYSSKIVQMVREAGYHMAVTTNNGWNKKDADLFTLKRIGIHNDMTFTPAMFLERVARG